MSDMKTEDQINIRIEKMRTELKNDKSGSGNALLMARIATLLWTLGREDEAIEGEQD